MSNPTTVSEVLQRFKLFASGILLCILILGVSVFSAPAWLPASKIAEEAKTSVLCIEGDIPEGSLSEALELLRSGQSEKLWILYLNLGETEKIIPQSTIIASMAEWISKSGIDSSRIRLFKLRNPDNDPQLAPKFLLKQGLEAQQNSFQILLSAWQSRSQGLAYSSVLEPAGIQVFIYPLKEKYTYSDWFLTWSGAKRLILGFSQFLYYKTLGVR